MIGTVEWVDNGYMFNGKLVNPDEKGLIKLSIGGTTVTIDRDRSLVAICSRGEPEITKQDKFGKEGRIPVEYIMVKEIGKPGVQRGRVNLDRLGLSGDGTKIQIKDCSSNKD